MLHLLRVCFRSTHALGRKGVAREAPELIPGAPPSKGVFPSRTGLASLALGEPVPRPALPFWLALLVPLALGPVRAAHAFSVLAHQAVVDRCWDDTLVPALLRRFPGTGDAALEEARAYAHGGSHIADLGYFPLGSRLFTDLVHYVRSGRFVTALLEDAKTPDEYAFALGAASHYVADTIGHPEATNRAVAEIYPDLRARYGDRVTYADDHAAHVETEFRFDILQLSMSRQTPDLFRHAIAFEVATPLLDRAFRETYGLGLDDLFPSTKVALSTYRWGFRELLEETTGIAWQLYRADIEKLDPAATAESFVGKMSRADFVDQFGDSFREPGYFAKFFAWIVKLIPDTGPLANLPYKALPPEVRAQYASAFEHVLEAYRGLVARDARGRVFIADRNLDTGRPTHRGDYAPADEAYAKLALTLDGLDFREASGDVREDLVHFYDEAPATGARPEDDRRSADVDRAIARLSAAPPGQ